MKRRTASEVELAADAWVAIDFETATRERDSACAFGIAVIQNGSIVESRGWLIQPPGNRYSSWNSRLHGITSQHTSASPVYRDLYPHIEPFLQNGLVLAHWAPFDMSVLRAVHKYYGLPLPSTRYACSCAMARRAFPGLPNHKLPTVCDHCGIELDNHHDAAADAVACAEVALRCHGVTGAASLHETVQVLGAGLRRL